MYFNVNDLWRDKTELLNKRLLKLPSAKVLLKLEFDTEDKVLYTLFFLFFFWSLFVKFALIEILTHLKRKYFIIFLFLCPTLHHIVNWIIKYPFISDKISIFFIDIYRLSAKWIEAHLSSEKGKDTQSLNSYNYLFEYFFSLAMFIEKFRLESNQVVYLSLYLKEGLKIMDCW